MNGPTQSLYEILSSFKNGQPKLMSASYPDPLERILEANDILSEITLSFIYYVKGLPPPDPKFVNGWMAVRFPIEVSFSISIYYYTYKEIDFDAINEKLGWNAFLDGVKDVFANPL